MGDRLGTLGAVGILLSIFFLQVPLLIFFSKKMKQGQSTLILECTIIFSFSYN